MSYLCVCHRHVVHLKLIWELCWPNLYDFILKIHSSFLFLSKLYQSAYQRRNEVKEKPTRTQADEYKMPAAHLCPFENHMELE